MRDDTESRIRTIQESFEEIGQRSGFLASRLEASRVLLDAVLGRASEALESGFLAESSLHECLDAITADLVRTSAELAWGAYPRAKESLAQAEQALQGLMAAIDPDGE